MLKSKIDTLHLKFGEKESSSAILSVAIKSGPEIG